MACGDEMILGAELAPLVLGSGSAIRAQVLRDAGMVFSVARPGVDEDVIKRDMAGAPGEEVALALAEAKALAVDAGREGVPGTLVLGADQIMRLDGALFDKVADMAAARERLMAMRGKTHELVSGVCLVRDGVVLERFNQVSALTMRDFSDAMLDWYLAQEGEAVLASVGCYRFEGPGVQLFSRIDGEYTAILGLPLMETLGRLRKHGAARV